MTGELAFRGAVRFFVIMLAASLASALAGGAFGGLVAAVSPEFVSSLFGRGTVGVIRYAIAIGMIWGLFIGMAVSGFACFLGALSILVKGHGESKAE